jgi:formyl-CoA transferase
MSINGTETSDPTRLGNPIVDIATGLFSTIAILMALHEREKSGRGQFCDMTLHDCGMALLHPHAANFFLSGKRPKATGNPHPNLAPYSKFQTRTCEIFVAAGNDPAFRKFCEFLGMAELASDPRFATNAARLVNRDALTEALSTRFADEDGHELTPRMLAIGLPAGPVLNVDEAMAADHTAHRKNGDGTRRLSRPQYPDQAFADAGRNPKCTAALQRAWRGSVARPWFFRRGDRRPSARGCARAEATRIAAGCRRRPCNVVGR